MVALDISETQNLAVTNDENGLKKSKKKKNKHSDSSDPTVITEKKSKNEKSDKKKLASPFTLKLFHVIRCVY